MIRTPGDIPVRAPRSNGMEPTGMFPTGGDRSYVLVREVRRYRGDYGLWNTMRKMRVKR